MITKTKITTTTEIQTSITITTRKHHPTTTGIIKDTTITIWRKGMVIKESSGLIITCKKDSSKIGKIQMLCIMIIMHMIKGNKLVEVIKGILWTQIIIEVV